MKKRAAFHFKKFTIHQSETTMPVTTDACIFGAISDLKNSRRILDIGCGTGLLSLMLAQRFPEAEITAVEIDKKAIAEAEINIRHSPFSNRIKLVHSDIRHIFWDFPFDGIVWNPPFFEKQLVSPDPRKNLARHTVALSLDDIPELLNRNLKKGGKAWILLPDKHKNRVLQLLTTAGYFMQSEIAVHPFPGKSANVFIVSVSTVKAITDNQVLYVRDDSGNYSQEMKELMQDFYLA